MSVHEEFAQSTPVPYVDLPGSVAHASYANGVGKRALDLAIAIPALVLLAPLLALFTVLIRLDSEGPVFFRQRRLGLHGASFEILKFRSMSVLENGDTITQVCNGDTRVTRVGRWMRRLSLDELPQLVNVINGEMSLIGPRPHALAHDIHYGRLIGSYGLRQTVKPGVTGWAQVHGLRGGTPAVEQMHRRVEYDVWYARHAGFWLDIQILFRTFAEVLRQRNAY